MALTSPDLRIVTTYDPRGEVDVQVIPPEREPWQGWRYSGMVGQATLTRLLDLALGHAAMCAKSAGRRPSVNDSA